MSVSPVLALTDVRFQYGSESEPVSVLNGVNFELNAGEKVTLVGRSGSGKSTLMNILAGLLLPSSGSVFWLGRSVEMMGDAERVKWRRDTIGVVYQFHHLLAEFTALENVMLPTMLSGAPIKEAEHRARELLADVQLSDRASHRPGELSGGERQRVAIARALSADPRVLLMDEPTGNLDEDTADTVLSMLMSVADKKGTSLLIVTHDRRVATQGDRCLALHHGVLEKP